MMKGVHTLLLVAAVAGLAAALQGGKRRADGKVTINEALGGGGIDDGAIFYPEMFTESPTTDNNTGVAHFLIDEAKNDGAVCLDGTPSAYYHRAAVGTGTNKWYIHQQGGGWCESLDSCLSRSKGQLGSSKDYPQTADLGGGYFSTDPAINPMMYNWNGVYMRYCDGDSFSGSNASTTTYQGATLHWRGRHILDAQINSLLDLGLKSATDVVISGCSAGGLATFLHCDHWAAAIHAVSPDTKVVCMPDSGFFLDYEGPPHYHSGMMWAFEQQNASSGVNADCIAAHEATQDTWMCQFAEHTAPHIKTPTFPLQAVYDSWQTANDLGSSDPVAINEWGGNVTALIENNLLSQPQHGVFLDSCHHHCGEWGNINISGDHQAQALQSWYDHGSAGLPNKGFWNQNEPYPCDACCKP